MGTIRVFYKPNRTEPNLTEKTSNELNLIEYPGSPRT